MRLLHRLPAVVLVSLRALHHAYARGGPFLVDDAALGAPGAVQLETVAGFSLQRSRERLFALRPGYTLSALPLQLSLGIEREGIARGGEGPKRRAWGTALAPEAKLRLLDLDAQGRPGLALKAGASWRASLQGGSVRRCSRSGSISTS